MAMGYRNQPRPVNRAGAEKAGQNEKPGLQACSHVTRPEHIYEVVELIEGVDGGRRVPSPQLGHGRK